MRNLILIVIIIFALLASLAASETQTKTRVPEAVDQLVEQNRAKTFELEQKMAELSGDPAGAEKLLYLRNKILLLKAESRKMSVNGQPQKLTYILLYNTVEIAI